MARVYCPPSHTPNPLLLVASEGVAAWMHPRVDTFAAGELWAVTLDRACSILGAYRLTRTHLAPVPGLTAHLLRFCDADGACRAVLVHKDVGGAGTLSGEILTLTTDLCALCKAIGVEILDQLVFDTRMKYTSLRKRGFFDSHRWWTSSVYPTASDLERHRIHNEQLGQRRRRAGSKHKEASPKAQLAPLPVAAQAASWVRGRLDGTRTAELWGVVIDNAGCICGGFRAGTPDSAQLPALLAGALVRTRHLGSSRVVVVEGRLPRAASPDRHPEWAAQLSQSARSIGLDIIDHVIVGQAADDCALSR